jgi:hypothetical protein
MKIFIFLIVISLISINIFSQKGTPLKDQVSGSALLHRGATTFNNDLALIKPLINTNDSNGGYYQEYWWMSFQYMLCGAVIKNTGTSVATNVFLEMKIFDYLAYLQSYFSDTIPVLNPGESITVNIPGELTFQPWIINTNIFEFHFIANSDSIDENPGNNEQVVPFTQFSEWMWTTVSRSVNVTQHYEVGQNTGFLSGDFLGFTVANDANWPHWVAYMKVFLEEPCDSLVLRAMLYENENLVDSANIPLPPPPYGDFIYSDMFQYSDIYPDSSYYIGVKFYFPEGHSFKIGVDTSLYHNFSTEPIARINGTWGPLNFIPAMQLICDPEAIPEKDRINPRVFPNPCSGKVYIENARDAEIELYDFSGKILFSEKITTLSHNTDISAFAPGIYFLRIINKEGATSRKIIIE